MDEREAQRVVEEYLGHVLIPSILRAVIIRLVVKGILDKFDLNYIKRWKEDSDNPK